MLVPPTTLEICRFLHYIFALHYITYSACLKLNQNLFSNLTPVVSLYTCRRFARISPRELGRVQVRSFGRDEQEEYVRTGR